MAKAKCRATSIDDRSTPGSGPPSPDFRFAADCSIAAVQGPSWPDEQIVLGTPADIRAKVRAAKITRTALILVGRVLDPQGFADRALYAPTHAHVLRPKRKA